MVVNEAYYRNGSCSPLISTPAVFVEVVRNMATMELGAAREKKAK